MPGFAAEASLDETARRYLRSTPGHRTGGDALTPQATNCDYGYIEGRPGLWIVCCDMAKDPPCEAFGIV
jgi:hypothetical protein